MIYSKICKVKSIFFLREVAGNVGPIGIFLCASDPSFQTLADGVYDNPDCCTGINHTPLITGYGTDKKHGDYWIVKNSWGRKLRTENNFDTLILINYNVV